VRASRSRRRDRPTDDTGSEGLSRRGWLLLVGITAAVGLAVVTAAILALGSLAGDTRAEDSPTSQAAAPRIPDLATGPTPLGLPPRPTHTLLATVPSEPVASLASGDCLQTYDSKWADSYPVVGCSAPHIAQLLSSGVLPEAAGSTFPGTAALDTEVSDLCQPHLNWDWVAVWNEDVQVDLRYPDTSEKWATGTRTYYCFVYTYSRHELTGSAVAGQ
jgi:hypothetical protein